MTDISEAILESIGDGFFAVDTNKKIITANKAAEELLGMKKKDLLGMKLDQLPLLDEKDDDIPLKKRPAALALSGKKVTSTRFSYVTKHKKRIPIALTAAPLVVSGKIIGSVSIFRDITQEKALERSKSEFIYIASHGLTTPLSVVKLYLEALQRNQYVKDAPEKIKGYIQEIYKSNVRAIALVRNLLSVSRIDQGKINDSPEMIAVIELVKKIVSEMNGIAVKNNVTLSFEKKGTIPELYIDPQRLREVVENLISNAIKYNHPQGKVFISVKREKDLVHFRVQDTGIGVSKKDQKKLSIKFFRTEKAAETNSEGTGLGLYVANSYIKAWGGTLEIQSEEGKGSTFSFAIPIKTIKS